MFSSLRLFQALPCPFGPSCQRPNCFFSHDPNVKEAPIVVPHDAPAPVRPASTSTTVPAKRVAVPSSSSAFPVRDASEPPSKLLKTGSAQRPKAVPAPSPTSVGVPVIRVNAARSKVPTSTRNTMLKSLYDHFIVLYDDILPLQPSLASEHALRQEEEIHARTTKFTYRNAVISSIASIKTRPPPTSLDHPSVGTSGDLATRPATIAPSVPPSTPTLSSSAQTSPSTSPTSPITPATPVSASFTNLILKPTHLAPLLLDATELPLCGFVPAVDPSWGPGSEKPSAVGERRSCERCSTIYAVHSVNAGEGGEECLYHWGKPFSKMINGERARLYTCCSRPTTDGGGCTRGPHVFYESEPRALHHRHAFSLTRPASAGRDTALDIAALDCEMVYTTGGFRAARVSVVDGEGKEVFDEIVKMDEGVEVIDFNSRFSGLTPESYAESARLPLAGIRRALDALISADTILLGHGLENDLRTLRMVHTRVVDTAVIFGRVDGRGSVWRRSLRDLAKEHLGRAIQTGDGITGHSSVEDSVATLDLVKWCVANGKRKPNFGAVVQGSPASAPSPGANNSNNNNGSATPSRAIRPVPPPAPTQVQMGKRDAAAGVSWLR